MRRSDALLMEMAVDIAAGDGDAADEGLAAGFVAGLGIAVGTAAGALEAAAGPVMGLATPAGAVVGLAAMPVGACVAVGAGWLVGVQADASKTNENVPAAIIERN